MRRFLLPLLTALALPTAVNAEISDEIHNRCKDAKDYVGCVQMMNKEKTENKIREVVNSSGTVYVFNPEDLIAKKVRGEYGRYVNFRYLHIKTDGSKTQWSVDADCEDYTADWDDDGFGWENLKKESNSDWAKFTIGLLDEFCPQMDRLVKEANSGTNNSSSAARYYKKPNSYNYQQNQKIRQLQMQQQTERYKKSLEQYGRYYNHPQYDYGY